jgi:hypothetical protein
MSDFTAMLEKMTLDGATAEVVAAANSNPANLAALVGQLCERYPQNNH